MWWTSVPVRLLLAAAAAMVVIAALELRAPAPVRMPFGDETGPTPDPPRRGRRAGLLGGALIGLVVAGPVGLAAGVVAAWVFAVRRSPGGPGGEATDLAGTAELLALALGAGLNLHESVAVFLRSGSDGPTADLLREAAAAARAGGSLPAELDRRAEPRLRPLVAILLDLHHRGADAVEPLRRLADRERLRTRRLIEARVRRLPVLLLFPLVVCVLPAFVVLLVPPLTALLQPTGT